MISELTRATLTVMLMDLLTEMKSMFTKQTPTTTTATGTAWETARRSMITVLSLYCGIATRMGMVMVKRSTTTGLTR